MSLPMTSSVNTIHTEYSGSLSGNVHYFKVGAATVRRKFDRAVIPALWKELWVGVMWGIEPEYRFNGPTAYQVLRNESDNRSSYMTIGLCNSSGSIPNDMVSGSVYPFNTFVSHSVAVNTVGASMNWATSSINNQFIELSQFGVKCVSNVYTTTAGASNGLLAAYDGTYKHYIVQFVRSSVAAHTTMSVKMIGYNQTNEEKNETPLTGSSALASALAAANVNSAATILSPANGSGGSTLNLGIVNETVNGEFDEVFISYGSFNVPLRIGCIATKVFLT